LATLATSLRSTRAAAARAVDRVLSDGRTLDRAFEDALDTSWPSRDLAEAKALAYGALRWHHRHRLIIAKLLKRPLRERDAVLEALLSVGLFQLINSRQPAYAVVSASVEASRVLKRGQAAGLINAALRRFERERENLLASVLEKDEGRFAHPQWFIDRVRLNWPAQWQAILNSGLEHPPYWIRVNRQKTPRGDYARRLKNEADIQSSELPGFPDALRLDRALAVTELPGFEQGLVSVQDVASQLAAELLAPEAGMRVLDTCAAPGGKAGHLLERGEGAIDLVAIDVDAARVELVNQNFQRLGQKAIAITADALKPDDWADRESFDRILVDAPCSSTGVIRRHPDIKFLRREKDIPLLAERQFEMLTRLWPLLKPGGRLLYSTCSVLEEENASVIRRFLDLISDAREIYPLAGPVLDTVTNLPGPGYQLLPGTADTDGFYYALMERQA
jgi:16S rRNA (cytosine967-C5)-methyltransferase